MRSRANRRRRLIPKIDLLWRMNARRLSFEEWRDTLLAVSGELDRTLGGRAAELFAAGSDNRRRTLYGLVDRQFLTTAMRTFDFANPDLHAPQRSETTVSQQALFAMNHPFVANRARGLVARLGDIPSADVAGRVRQLYRLAYQRDPTEAQEHAALAFLAAPPENAPAARPETLAWQYGYGKLFEAEGRVDFHPLPHFTGSAWQGGPQWPDAALGWVQLTAAGGHAGNDLEHAAIRRWTAPRAGNGEHQIHGDAPSGGGRRHPLLDRLQPARRVGVGRAAQPATVARRGDTSGRGGRHDRFRRRFQRQSQQRSISLAGGDQRNRGAEFSGPRRRQRVGIHRAISAARRPICSIAWEQFAQVLLLANELMFVD